MTQYISIDQIPSLPDGTVIPVLTGKVFKVFEPKKFTSKPDEQGKVREFYGYSYLLEAPSGTIMVSTLHKELAARTEQTGVMVKLISTQGDNGLRGITKESYMGKDSNDQPVKRIKVKADHGAVMSLVAVPQPATKPQPASPPNQLRAIAREWRACYDAAREVVPVEFTPVETISVATTLFIECQRKGIKLPIVGATEPVAAQPDARTEPTSTPTTESPKRTPQSLATKIIMGAKITVKDLEGVDLEQTFDCAYREAANEVPKEHLDAAFDAAKKRHKGDEGKLYRAILTHWTEYVADAKRLRSAKETQAIELEEPAIEL